MVRFWGEQGQCHLWKCSDLGSFFLFSDNLVVLNTNTNITANLTTYLVLAGNNVGEVGPDGSVGGLFLSFPRPGFVLFLPRFHEIILSAALGNSPFFMGAIMASLVLLGHVLV